MSKQKLRMTTWYWGNFVTSPLPHTKRSDYEVYSEQAHGWQHSEEFKSGYMLRPYNSPNVETKETENE